MTDHQTHLTPDAHRRLLDELDERSTTRRREISAWIERAREHGDIRENADYDAAKNEQGLNEARIRQLEAILGGAVVVEATESDVVASGNIVSIRMGSDVSEYLVGSIEERHDRYDVLSMNSPLGKALLGHAPGETIRYEAPAGALEVEIIEIRPVD